MKILLDFNNCKEWKQPLSKVLYSNVKISDKPKSIDKKFKYI